MSEISLEDCDSWTCVSSATSESPVTTHVLVVENFENVMKESKIGSRVASSQFEIEDTKWKIIVYPAGQAEENKEYIRISVQNDNATSYEVKFRISCCGVTVSSTNETEVRPGKNRGFTKFIKSEDCLKKLVDEKLYVKAEVSIVRKGNQTIVSGKGKKEKKEDVQVSKLVESIYTSKVHSDFKLVSNDKEYECHKNFIASQSETLKNIIDRWAPDGKMIMDEYRPEVVEGLLSFCYRRPLDQEVFEANVVDFLNIGEKYDLPDLKVKAEIFMITNMKKETFIEFLVAADLFKAGKVKEAAIKFLSSNKILWKENIQEWKEKLKGKDVLLMEIITAYS